MSASAVSWKQVDVEGTGSVESCALAARSCASRAFTRRASKAKSSWSDGGFWMLSSSAPVLTLARSSSSDSSRNEVA